MPKQTSWLLTRCCVVTGCAGRYQDADIALDVSQGDYDCDSKCARYASAHTTVNTPRQIVGDSLLGGIL